MSGSELASIIVTIVCLAVVVVLVLAVQALIRTLRELRLTVEELRSTTLPMVGDLHATVNQAQQELQRVDTVIGNAERITSTVDVVGRLTHKVMAPPLIKVLAVAKGVTGARRRLSRPSTGEDRSIQRPRRVIEASEQRR